jgi:hypothetical protein
MKKARPNVTMPGQSLATLARSNNEEMRDRLKHEEPTGWRVLSVLKPHPSPSRPLDYRHVLDMAHSIAALGLIQPLVVDIDDVVVAGGHRFAALLLLGEGATERKNQLAFLCPATTSAQLDQIADLLNELPTVATQVDFQCIPIRALPLRIATDAEAAWRIEVAENERRKDYKPKEVRAIAERLQLQGYRLRSGGGGTEPRALPVLTALLGKSERQVRRILREEDNSRPNVRELIEDDSKIVLKSLMRFKALHHDELNEDLLNHINSVINGLSELAK